MNHIIYLLQSNLANVLMVFIIVTTGILISLGLFFIIAHVVKLPTYQSTRAIVTVSKIKSKENNIDAFVFDMASKLMPYIRMDEYRKRKYQSILLSAGMSISPEMYMSLSYVKALVFLIPGIVVYILKGIFPSAIESIFAIFGLVLIILSVFIFLKSITEANEIAKIRRDEIEGDLPRFVTTIVEGLKSTRDIRQLIENYMRYNEGALSKELFITVGDISSGNAEIALTRLDARIGSNLLSQVIRGLIGVLRGDDGLSYFNNLNRDFKEIEFQRLRKIALTKPPKIKRCSFALLVSLMITLLGIVGSAVFQGATVLF